MGPFLAVAVGAEGSYSTPYGKPLQEQAAPRREGMERSGFSSETRDFNCRLRARVAFPKI